MSAVGRASSGLGRSGFSAGVRFLLLAIVCIALMLLDRREQHLVRVRQALALVVYPVQVAVDLPFSTWHSMRDTFAARDALIAENREFRRERLETEGRLQRLESLERENQRLRELLDSTARVNSRALVAEILSVDLDPYRQRFELNRGLVDGVYVGQALIDAQGVVGQVVRVGPLTSEALLITDADHAVPVTVYRNDLRTIAVGTGDSGRLRLPYLVNNANIVVGDVLMSSGLGGVFPSGYPVGRVTEVTLRPEQAFAEVLAEPASLLDRDREVLLLWDSSEAAPEVAEPQAAQAESDASVAELH
ncbi:MAG TPA: rod shape-determining protein MreC [Gammaproteobacteria bacterium]|nr:rod shape-determining protein MreC [Gammaproteobacteria bacterium]